jgi:hypothetical protein
MPVVMNAPPLDVGKNSVIVFDVEATSSVTVPPPVD